MKLALVRQKYNPFGGAERFVERALAALAAQGVTTTLITRSWQGPAGQPVLVCNPFHAGRLWRDRSFARCVQAVIARGEFDLVQSHERIPGCDIYRAGDGVHATWLELRGHGQGALARLATSLNPWHRYTLAAEAAMFRDPRLKAVICNSRMVRDDIARRFGVPAEKLHVIYNGVDLEAFHLRLRGEHRDRLRGELGIAEDTPLFLFVGSGFERKGVPHLLEAFAAMKDREAVLLVVGRDRQQAALERKAMALGLSGRVRFLGGRKDVKPFYGAADAFVLPTLYDPFPNAVLEALACGLPVITTTQCGAAELICAGENGFVCAALDVAQLADRLDALVATAGSPRGATAGSPRGTAGAMREAARASVEHLSIGATAETLLGLYRHLIAQESRG
jgi:UDP-glucose:(heptosyl)LPS alpha-1,3-glucosyltransferase